MIWLQLLGVFGWLKKAALSVFSAAVRYPWQAALIVAVAASCWLWRGKQQALHDLSSAQAEIALIRQASDANRKAAEDQVKRIQAQYDQSAQEAQHEYEANLAAARGGLSDYVRSHRLPRQAGSQCAATGTSEGKDSPVSPNVSPDPGMVAVRETDLQALVDWLAVGVESHNQAVDKINRGVAFPDPAFGAPSK